MGSLWPAEVFDMRHRTRAAVALHPGENRDLRGFGLQKFGGALDGGVHFLGQRRDVEFLAMICSMPSIRKFRRRRRGGACLRAAGRRVPSPAPAPSPPACGSSWQVCLLA